MTVFAAIVIFVATAAVGTAEPPTDQPKVKEAQTETKPEPAAQPTAEDVLRALQRRRPVNDVIPPVSRAAREAVASSQKLTERLLVPEGLSIVGRTGRLSQQGLWWVFAFDDDPNAVPMKLLPNANLELMVRTLHGAPSPIRFTTSGELTVFEGENFFLPRVSTRAGAASEPPAKISDAPATPTRVKPAASAEDVLTTMRAQQPGEVVIPSLDPSSEIKSGMQSTASLLSDGASLMNRVGRLVRQGSWWTFVSDSDRPDHPEPTLRLLPNQSVERMAKESQRGGSVFIVSGEVTLFDGANYLLVRVATRRLDSGNLRR